MISAKYHDATKTSYHFIRTDSSEGDAYPDGARWKDIEEERIKAGITPEEHVGPTDMELWEKDMIQSDILERMSRELEEHITDEHGGVAGTIDKQERYDRKIKKRSLKPKI